MVGWLDQLFNGQPQPQQGGALNMAQPQQGGLLTRMGDALIAMGDPYGISGQMTDPRQRQQAIGQALMNVGTGIHQARTKNPFEAIGQGFQYAGQQGMQTAEAKMRGELFKQQITDKQRKAAAQQKIAEIMKDPNRRAELPAALAELDAGAAVNYQLGREDKAEQRGWQDKRDAEDRAFRLQLQGMNHAQQRQLIELKNQLEQTGGGKFSNQPVYVTDDQGNVRVMQLNQNGKAILTELPDGVKVAPNLNKVDTGTGTVLVDPRTGQTQSFIPKDVASAESQKAQGRAAGEKIAEAPAAQAAINNSIANLDRLRDEAQAILDDPALGKITGFVGMIPNIPGGSAANVEARLETLKSQIGFRVLQDMRDASKTGGALGQVSNIENVLLQQNIAALSQAQSPEAFRRSLRQIIDYTTGAKERLRDGYVRTYGSAPPTAPTTPAAPQGQPSLDDLLNKYAPR